MQRERESGAYTVGVRLHGLLAKAESQSQMSDLVRVSGLRDGREMGLGETHVGNAGQNSTAAPTELLLLLLSFFSSSSSSFLLK